MPNLIPQVLSHDETVTEIRELERAIAGLISNQVKLSPILTQLRDTVLTSHWEVEQRLQQRISEKLYTNIRPKYYMDGPDKLRKRVDEFEETMNKFFTGMTFRSIVDLALDLGVIDDYEFENIYLLNRYRNNFVHLDLAKISLFEDAERRKNLLVLIKNILLGI